MDARPSLWVTYASTLTMAGKPVDKIEQIVQCAENALNETTPDEINRDLIGQVAAIRAMIAIPQNQVDDIITQSRRALEYLSPQNVSIRTTAAWTLGYAYQFQGNRAAAFQAHQEALSSSLANGNTMISIAALTSLGQIQLSENQLNQAAEYFRRVLQLAGASPLPVACEAYLGLARISYQWNDLEAAQRHVEQSLRLAQKMESIDTPANCQLLFARLKLTRGDLNGASGNLVNAEELIHQQNFSHLIPEVVALQVLISLTGGDLLKAAELADKHNLPLSQARVHLAQRDAAAALEIITSYRLQMETQDWHDEQLKAMILQAMTLYALGKEEQAAG